MKKSRFSFFRKRSSTKEVKTPSIETRKKKEAVNLKKSPLEKTKKTLTAEGAYRKRKANKPPF